MSKKVLIRIGLVLLILTTLFSFLGINNPNKTNQTVQKTNLKIAVVNEDGGTIYNGESITISKTLLKSFANQTDYVVEEVTRSIAERGLENDTYQLMIILPSKFSENSLALESTNPNKAIFQYQIKSEKPLVIKQAEEAVFNFKSMFNKDLINIYFLSIIENLQTAQTQMYELVTNEKEVLNSFQSNLTQPLASHATQFSGLASSPTSLLSLYSLFDKELNSSNEAFTSIINVDKTYEKEVEKIKELQDAWRKSIDEKGKSLEDYDTAVAKLSVQTQLEALQKLNTYFKDNFNDPKIWKESEEKATKFNNELATLVTSLKSLNTKIDTTLSNYNEKITSAIEESLNNTVGTQQLQKTLGSYIKNIRETMLLKLDTALQQGIFFDDSTLAKLGLSVGDTQYLKNINTFMNWYTTENNKTPVLTQNETKTNQHITKLKQSAVANLETTKAFNIQNIEGKIKEIKMSVPAGYELQIANHSFVKIDDTTYSVTITDENATSLEIQYKLTTNQDTLNLIDVVNVQVDVKTKENLEVATGEQTTDTVIDTSSGVMQIITTIKDKTNPKVVIRVYTQNNSISNLFSYKTFAESQAFYQDIQSYLEVAALAKAFYDVDLHQPFNGPAVHSLFKQSDINDLKTIIAGLIKDVTITTLKDDLKISNEKLQQFESLSVNGTDLKVKLEELRKSTADASSKLQSILAEAENIQKTLEAKPQFIEHKIEDNTELVTVSMKMNTDLMQLMSASKTLMDNTKSNQEVSKNVQSAIEKLSSDVSNLEKEGNSLTDRVAHLQKVMSDKYATNQDFLKGFANVLQNTKTGNRTNEAVYEYLSNPVEANKVLDVIGISQQKSARQDDRSGLLIVLIGYLVALSIAYLLQHADLSSLQKRKNMLKRVDWKNATQPLLFLTALGAVAGLLIGVVSSYKLDMSFTQGLLLSVITITAVLTFTYMLNLLLAKVKSLGFLVAIALLLLYVISVSQLMGTIDSSSFIAVFSPLTHIENSLTGYINHTNSGLILLSILVVLSAGLAILNGFIYRSIPEKSE